MKTQAIYLLLIPLCSSVLMLSGCASPGKNMIPQGGAMTMTQIYRQETGMSLSGQDSRVTGNTVPEIRHHLIVSEAPSKAPSKTIDYTATAKNEVNTLFKRLPNPTVPLYVYPHLVHLNGEAYPKPGITTDFFLYRSNHFAMPNEIY